MEAIFGEREKRLKFRLAFTVTLLLKSTPNIHSYKESEAIYLDTVAGEALSMLWGSKTTLQLGAMGIRSPFAKVRVLLSSNTLLRFSIQIASTGPSNTIQICSPYELKDKMELILKAWEKGCSVSEITFACKLKRTFIHNIVLNYYYTSYMVV